jgi:CsoR family transcriptional regulator, copper-sensing transcriptional repressor
MSRTAKGVAVTPPGYSEDKAAVLGRLKRIEGQVRGLERMVEDERYCIDVLQQISAVTRALQGVALHLLDEHMEHCVAIAVKAGGRQKEAKLREASEAIARLVKS